jgi:hypothetical protein
LPRGTTTHPDWQRAMSIMAGDPTIRIGLEGFTDCVGTQSENLDLRQRRIDSVVAAMPPAVRSRVVFSWAVSTAEFVDPTNATPEGRASNRSVRVTYRSIPARGTDACDTVPQARTVDEFLFLVRCMEGRLGLASPADAPRALSVLRQIYYGSSPWTFRRGRDPIWAMVISTRPWRAGTDPSAALGPVLGALHASQTLEGIDVGHVLAGIDAMMAPGPVEIPLGPAAWITGVPREEWATWVGDVGAAAADWAIDVLVNGATPATLDARFTGHASDDDLAGDINAFALRAGLSGGATPASLAGQPIRLTGTLSDALMQYFRITSSGPGRARAHPTEVFVQSYGGTMSGGRIADPAAFAARLRPTVQEFAFYYMMQGLAREQYFARQSAPSAPDPRATLDFAVTEMTNRFIRWLEAHP